MSVASKREGRVSQEMRPRRPDLQNRALEADEGELLALISEHLADLEPTVIRKVLKNPHASSRVLEVLAGSRRVRNSPQMIREIVSHPRVPEARALDLVPRLGWRDLARIGAEVRARPKVRRAADLRLTERLSSLALGERVAVARQGGPGIISLLRKDPSPKVVAALLENSRLTEGLLMPMLSSDLTLPAVLETIAEDRKWGIRYNVRATLARNPRTPVTVALRILPALKKSDLATVAASSRVAPRVRRRAELLLGPGTS
jgi:hypothetical protein